MTRVFFFVIMSYGLPNTVLYLAGAILLTSLF